jgi:cation:H+ antiporter
MTQKTNTAEAEQNTAGEAPANSNAVTPKKKRDFTIFKSHFATAGRFVKEDKGIQPGAIAMGILLGTTALATPLLGSALGAAGAMAVGMYLLMKTSDTVVNNMAVLGKKMGIAPMTLGIGLGLLTSLPELLVSGGAIMQGNPAIGIGNIAGSNIANILLILGATAAIRKIEGKGNSWKFNAAVMGVSTAAFATQMALGALNPFVGAAMLGGLGLYMWQSYKRGQKDMPTAEEQQAAADAKAQAAQNGETAAEEPSESKLPTWMNISLGLAGVAGLVGAASFLVASATAFGIAAGVSPALVGVLGVAIGTSLPELTVNIKAALKGETDMAIGNVLGSNVFNLLMIGGIVSLTGAEVPADLNPRETLMGFVNTAAFGVSALLAWGAMKLNNGGITRKQGVAGVALYAAYTTATVMLGTADPSAAAGAATTATTATPVPPPPPAGP